ncbi:nucleotide pyrophosphatase [Endozoicomonas sp. OPT23]|uniref:alkaline phosphatase family protein n=1 Tax=Endozoicomonas sp. OPT23 TaxID=2072845 RepID=UPI00129A3D9D|nr:alkaline phosphatase family protein [Endozoicomonas sp. OPT23]MRI32900.1 nucleotide pyrophosphatase [Endozoicomonas sp. OPT23]
MKNKRNLPAFISGLSAFVLTALISTPVTAAIEKIPVVGEAFNASLILKNEVISTLGYSARLTRDTALFTVAGLTLDAYILTLPLDKNSKKRVVSQLANPAYAIPLGYFLYSYYDRYTGISDEDVFKAYLQTVYDQETLKEFEHSLFQLSEKRPETEKEQKQTSHHQGLVINREFIASMVTVYDALFEIDEWRKFETLPSHYSYLTSSDKDLELINRIQPIVVDTLSKTVAGMDKGDIRSSLESILQDAEPDKRNLPNNKIQAITVTLIDFVRYNLLKGWRQFVYQEERTEALTDWMKTTFSQEPERLIRFLASQQQRRLAVQITVDGLQQGLIEGLVDQNKPFIATAWNKHQQKENFKPASIETSSPEHIQQMRFLDSLNQSTYKNPNYLPFFHKLYQNYSKSIASVGISSTPTISVRNLPIIKTGAKVSGNGGTGIPNFHFVDREEDRAYYFFGNDALQLERLAVKNNVQTMFDRLNHLKTLSCNAQYDWNAHVSYDALINLGLGESQRDYGEKRCLRELQERAKNELKATELRAELITDIKAYQDTFFLRIFSLMTRKSLIRQKLEELVELDIQSMPDYVLIYNPWPDHFAHFTGPFSDEVIMPTGELNRLDYWLGQLEATYKDAGIYDQTLWGMAGDHGLSPVYYTLNPEKIIFESLQEELPYPISIRKISSDEGEGPKISNAISPLSNKATDVVVASTAGGNYMLDFFNSAQGWTTQPVYQELTQWRPLSAPDTFELDMIEAMADSLAGTLDYLVVRESECSPAACSVRLINKRGDQRQDELIIRKEDRTFYQSLTTDEPSLLQLTEFNLYLPRPDHKTKMRNTALISKCLAAKETDTDSWCTEDEWRQATQFSPKPDAINQLAHIYDEDRAGTINLFPAEGIGYNTVVPGRHAGESYPEKDAFIGFWGAPLNENKRQLTIEQNGSLAPTLYQYLTGEQVLQGENGWGYPSLLDKLSTH